MEEVRHGEVWPWPAQPPRQFQHPVIRHLRHVQSRIERSLRRPSGIAERGRSYWDGDRNQPGKPTLRHEIVGGCAGIPRRERVVRESTGKFMLHQAETGE